jgi:hypothetical protein
MPIEPKEFRDELNCVYATVWVHVQEQGLELVQVMLQLPVTNTFSSDSFIRRVELLDKVAEYVKEAEYQVQLRNIQTQIEQLDRDDPRAEILDQEGAELIRNRAESQLQEMNDKMDLATYRAEKLLKECREKDVLERVKENPRLLTENSQRLAASLRTPVSKISTRGVSNAQVENFSQVFRSKFRQR